MTLASRVKVVMVDVEGLRVRMEMQVGAWWRLNGSVFGSWNMRVLASYAIINKAFYP